MVKKLVMTIVGLTILIVTFAGCNSPNETGLESAGCIAITSMTEAIGGVSPDVTDEQELTYKVTLRNNGAATVHVVSIEPGLNSRITDRVLEDSLLIAVGRNVEPDSYLTAEGHFRFDASGLSKQDIDSMGHIIIDIRVSLTTLLEIPDVANRRNSRASFMRKSSNWHATHCRLPLSTRRSLYAQARRTLFNLLWLESRCTLNSTTPQAPCPEF